MSAYNLKAKSSISKVILNKLGITDLRVKVNCWYCNQDACIFPGSRDTVYCWTCHLCGNVNSRDEKGDVIDPSPIETSLQRSSVAYVARNPSVVKKYNKNTVCESCQDNLQLIQELLEEYIPDETDPDYKSRYDSADAYAADLHRRYGLCNNCRAKIDTLFKEQQEQFCKTKINTLSKTSSTTESPVRPNVTFYTKGIFWGLMHFFTLFYVLYALIYLSRDVPINAVNLNVAHLNNSIVVNPTLGYKDMIIQFFMLCRYFYDLEVIQAWIARNQVQMSILINLLSYSIILWHPIQRKSNIDYKETRNWSIYKLASHVLFIARFAFIFLVNYNITSTLYIIALLVIYYIALFTTYISVRDTPFQPLVNVGKSFSSNMVFDEDTRRGSEVNGLPYIDDAMSIGGEDLGEIENITNRIRCMSFSF